MHGDLLRSTAPYLHGGLLARHVAALPSNYNESPKLHVTAGYMPQPKCTLDVTPSIASEGENKIRSVPRYPGDFAVVWGKLAMVTLTVLPMLSIYYGMT
jgi:hypothetical protein